MYLKTIDGLIYKIVKFVMSGYICQKYLNSVDDETIFIDRSIVDSLSDNLEEILKEGE